MESQSTDGLSAELERATGVLQQALSEACGTEVTSADTGQLARMEEVLLLAGEAAHKAVTIRRRNKRPARRSAPPSDEAFPVTHRMFVDSAGVKWDAFAVYPSPETTGRARLPEPYQRGWLSFDSGLERRRLSPIPDGWQEAAEATLAGMCDRAEPAPRRLTPERSSRQQ